MLVLLSPLITASGFGPVSATALPPCTAPNTNMPLWTLTGWSTNFTDPEGDTVIFRLSNELTEYEALCVRQGLYPEGQCYRAGESTTGVDNPPKEDDTGTLFSYNEWVGKLEVYQEWSCTNNR